MGFLDRFQGNNVDPMAEVSANAVAHLRERNLKFRKFMLDKVQDLEEKAAMGQQRLPEPDADAADFGDSDFTDHGPDTRVQPAGEEDMRISLEAGVLLTAEQAAGDPDSLPVIETAAAASAAGAPERISVEPENIPEPAPAETLPESEQAPVEEEAGSPNWEDIFGIGATTSIAAEAAADDAVAAEAASEVEFETPEPASEVQQPATEVVETAESPPTAGRAPQEVIMPQENTAVQENTAAQESTATQESRSGGGSLMWDWRSLSAQNTDDGSEQSSADAFDPAWESEAAGSSDETAAVEDEAGQTDDGSTDGTTDGSTNGSVDGTVSEQAPVEDIQLPASNETEDVHITDLDDTPTLDVTTNEEISDEGTVAPDTADETDRPDPAGDIQVLTAADEGAQEDEEFIPLGDTQEKQDMIDIPLPDELGEFS